MDPLSIIASAIAIVGALNAAVQKAQELRTATSTLHALTNELSDLTLVLQASEHALRDPAHGPVLRQDATLILAAQSIKTKLDRIAQRMAHWTGSKSNQKYEDVRRLNWMLCAPKSSRIKDEVRALRIELMTVLNAVAVIKSSRIQLDLQQIYLLSENAIASQEAFCSNLATNHREQLIQLNEISTKIDDIRIQNSTIAELPGANCSGIPDDPPAKATHQLTRISAEQPKAFHHNGGILFDSKQLTAVSAVGIRTAQFSRMACKPWCNCVCHSETSFKSPSFMERLVGSLFIGYSGMPRFRLKCNQQSCHLESQPMIYITYFFPTWFLARMISLMIALTPLAGPVVSLKTQRTVSGDADIFLCAKTGNIDKMKYLFANGLASPHDVSLSSGITALHYAISYQQLETCKFLLQANADPFLEDRSRWTAADNAWGKILSGRFPREKEDSLRMMFSDTECLERWNLTVIHKIVLGLIGNDLEQELEASTAEIDATDSNGRTALSFAAERSDLNALSLLLRYGADPKISSPEQGSPLHFAATALNAAAISVLLKHGADVDCTTSYSQTPLHYAAAYHSSENHAEALLQASANPNFKDRDGMTPLHWTAVSGNASVAKTILSHRGDKDIVDNHGDTALSGSIKSNQHAVISLLLHHNAHTGGRLTNEETILHAIASSADLETLRRLRGLHLDVSILSEKLENGQTALEILKERPDYNAELEAEFLVLFRLGASYSDDESDSDDHYEDAFEDFQD